MNTNILMGANVFLVIVLFICWYVLLRLIDEIAAICNIRSISVAAQCLGQSDMNGLFLLQDVMNHLGNYIYVVNLQTFEVLFTNEKTRNAIQGFKLGKPCYNLFRGNVCQCADCPIRDLTVDTNRCIKEIYNEKLHIWTEVTVTTLLWRDGSIAGLIDCVDITKRKMEQQQHITQLEKLAYVDELTGGRTYHKFKIDGQQILESQKNSPHFIMKLDVDNFKLINQICGYEKGDMVLRNIATAISMTVRDENDIFARLVNDEFVALFTLWDSSDLQALYEVFLGHFHSLMGNDFSFRCNFPHGCYVVHPCDLKKTDIMDMLEKVNLAHKAAKVNKSLDFAMYDESMIELAIYKKEIENKMADALENGEFLVYLQPKYMLQDKVIAGAEALVRWRKDGQSLISPNSFIPVFEQNGFITKLDFYMLDKVCGILEEWIAQGITPVVTSVNISRLHLNNPHFVQNLCDIVDRHGIHHRYIEIEITETIICDNFDALEILLDELHDKGFSMSMDDFGSGYSSLGLLKNLPVDIIKMDRSFFAGQADSDRAKIVMSSVINMAENLGVHVVAEGIEEEECFEFLRDLHCEMGQGYYFSKPLPVEAFTQLLNF